MISFLRVVVGGLVVTFLLKFKRWSGLLATFLLLTVLLEEAIGTVLPFLLWSFTLEFPRRKVAVS